MHTYMRITYACKAKRKEIHFVFRIDFMVKLLRACVWMPWRK